MRYWKQKTGFNDCFVDVFELFFTLEKLFRKIRRSFWAFAPAIGASHCDKNYYLLSDLGYRYTSRPPTGDSLVQEGALFYQKKGFLLDSYFLYPFPENHRGSDLKKSPSLNTIFPPMITMRGKRARWPSKGVQPHLLWSISGVTGRGTFSKRRR